MSAVSDLITTVEKRDSLGRRRNPKQQKIYQIVSVRIDRETVEQIKAKGKLGQKIRDYIEWGLENDR